MRAARLFKRKLKNNHHVNDLKTDSREISPGDVFFVIRGERFDGQDFIISAIAKGAQTIVSDRPWPKSDIFPDINFLVVMDVEKTLAEAAKIFYQNLSAQFTLIGITGTNGKTTVSTLIYKYFQFLNKKATLIGTNGIYIMNNFYATENTTPQILEIYRVLRESKKAGVSVIVMEVSSHAVKLLRVYGLEFKVVLITNLTRDHLDFHRTMEDYKYTKALFLHSADASSHVIINLEIDDFRLFYRLARGRVITYGESGADYTFENPEYAITGTSFLLRYPGGELPLETNLLGRFNVYNILAFIAAVSALELFPGKVREFLASRVNILGRMEVLNIDERYFVIDFAHTPDGVCNVLEFLVSVKENKLYVVIGCGGDRDRGKRRVIGGIVSEFADFVIFTNDNPRSEPPEAIIADILEGVKSDNYVVILDRETAIAEAFRRALKGDIIAVLGKGNEQHQIIGDEKIPYNDKNAVRRLKP